MKAPELLSGGLSAQELEYYADGAWYDAEYVHIRGDIPYYANAAAENEGPILELACGTGRLSIPMAHVGAHVTGVDVAPGMIAHANRKRAELPPGDQDRLRFVLEDMRTMRLGERFKGVVLAFNTMMHMTRDEDLAGVLETVRAHLRPEGRFYFDLHTPHPGFLSRDDPAGRFDPQEMIDPHTRERYIVTENNSYDPREQINIMRFYYRRVMINGMPEDAERAVTLRLRVIFPRELDHWLALHGFAIEEEWDDFERRTPFTATGGRRIVRAKLR